jgi:hypothetical protein
MGQWLTSNFPEERRFPLTPFPGLLNFPTQFSGSPCVGREQVSEESAMMGQNIEGYDPYELSSRRNPDVWGDRDPFSDGDGDEDEELEDEDDDLDDDDDDDEDDDDDDTEDEEEEDDF